MKGAPDADELVAIVAAYVILTREQRRRLAAVPAPVPVPRWRRAARIEGLERAGTAPLQPDRFTR